MFCQVFTAATLSCCFFVGLSAFSLVFSNWKACSIGLRSGEWLGYWRIFHFFNGQVMAMPFEVCLGSLSICNVKMCPISFVTFGWMWAESIAVKTSELILLLLSAVTSSINTSEPFPLGAIHAHVITQPPPCLTLDVVCFGSWAVPFFHHTSLFPSS